MIIIILLIIIITSTFVQRKKIILRCANPSNQTNNYVFKCLANVATINNEARVRILCWQKIADDCAGDCEVLAPVSVLIVRTTRWVSADLKSRLLATNETDTQWSARYGRTMDKACAHLIEALEL